MLSGRQEIGDWGRCLVGVVCVTDEDGEMFGVRDADIEEAAVPAKVGIGRCQNDGRVERVPNA
eukprot:9519666-Lingulodinium_polyedra.AAC.1